MSLHLSVSRPLSVSLTASRSLCVRSLKPSIWADICLSLGCYWALCSLLAAIAYALDFSYGSPFIYLCSIWKTKQYMLICFCWPLLLEPIGWCPIGWPAWFMLAVWFITFDIYVIVGDSYTCLCSIWMTPWWLWCYFPYFIVGFCWLFGSYIIWYICYCWLIWRTYISFEHWLFSWDEQ